MAQFTIYKSTDGSAPVLTGQAGKLTDLLDACLVNGYGAKAAAGWSIAFTATNRRAYRGGAGTQLYLRVRDDAGGTGGAKEALARGFETMSDVNTGTNPFPTSAQLSSTTDNSLVWRKSVTADATARPWIVVADNKTVYVFIQTGDVALAYFGYTWGDFDSFVSGDVWNCVINGRATENTGSINGNHLVSGDLDAGLNFVNNASGSIGCYTARPYTGIAGGAQAARMYPGCSILGNPANGGGGLLYPNAADNAIYMTPTYLTFAQSSAGNLRGRFRGLWNWWHVGGANDGDTFNGGGDLAGKSFLVIKASPNAGMFIIETSNTVT